MSKIKDIILTTVFALFILAFSLLCIFLPSEGYSDAERRALKAMPELNGETLISGEFMNNFEEYCADNFPFRDTFRTVKAVFSTRVLGKMENNGLFLADGHISKTDQPQNDFMMENAAQKFLNIKNKFLKDKNTKEYFCIVPDKNYFIAPKNGYPSLDYQLFISEMKKKTEYMKYIDITNLLSADDYYKTDTHWKQECITDVAQAIAGEMGTHISGEYTVNTLDRPFYGVYAGQSALPCKPDTIKYLTGEIINGCTVTYYDTGMPKTGDIYNMEKAMGKDAYEMFLSGTMPVAEISNPAVSNGKKLIIFRDSFGSSIAPLLAEGYEKVTVFDIRYIQSDFVGNFADFENCDVLFIYSTALLNNSTAMK